MKEELKNPNLVIFPTDKTGSFVAMETKLYIEKMQAHLVKAGGEIKRVNLVEIE